MLTSWGRSLGSRVVFPPPFLLFYSLSLSLSLSVLLLGSSFFRAHMGICPRVCRSSLCDESSPATAQSAPLASPQRNASTGRCCSLNYPRPALLPPHGQINHSISSVYLLPWTSAGSTLNASPTKLKLIVRLFGHRTLPPHPPPTLSLSLSLAGDAFGAGGRDYPPVGMRRQDLAAARCAH